MPQNLSAVVHPMTLRRHILVLTLAACVLILGYMAMLDFYARQSYQAADSALHSYQVLKSREGITEAVFEMFAATRDHVILGDVKAQQRLDQSATRLLDQIDILLRLTTDNSSQQANLMDLKTAAQGFVAICRQQIAQPPLGYSEVTAGLHEELRQELVQDSAGIFRELAHFSKTESGLLEQRRQQAATERQILLTILTAGGVILIELFLLGASWMLRLAHIHEQASARLQQSDERLRLVTEGINEGVYDIDYVMDTVYVSPAYETMLGYDRAAFARTPEFINGFIHPDDFPHVKSLFDSYKQREIPTYSTTVRLRHHDGHWLWMLSRAVGIWDDDGKLLRIIGTHTDITEQKNREAQLKELNAELENMTYIASHDLQTPLVNFRGFMGEITLTVNEALAVLNRHRDKIPADLYQQITKVLRQDLGESQSYIDSAIAKMEKLVADILELSRIGRRVYQIECVDVDQIVDQCLHTMAFEINQHQAKIERTAQLPPLYSDHRAVEQVFSNILDNAVKYLSPERQGIINIAAQCLPHQIIFSISDNGRGIAPQERPLVFDVGRRASPDARIRGMGMGMAFVMATMRKLGGSVWFESTLGQGTTFYLVFPIVLPNATKLTQDGNLSRALNA